MLTAWRPGRAVLGVGIVATAAALFVVSLRAAGLAAVTEAVSKVQLWFGVVLLLGGFRFLARAAAWRLCLERPSTFPLSSAFIAVAAGSAIGSATPFGALASEPAKVLAVSARAGASEAAAALAVENLFYVASVLVTLSVGGAALCVALGYSTSAVVIVIAVMLATLAGFRFATASLASRSLWARTRRRVEVRAGARMSGALVKLDRIANALAVGFRAARPRITTIAALEMTFHLAAVVEIAIIVGAMGAVRQSVVSAAILEAANRLTMIAFQFLPLRLGVDEAVSGLTAEWLRVGAPIGVGVALVRKGRMLCWSAIGFALAALLTRGGPAGDPQ